MEDTVISTGTANPTPTPTTTDGDGYDDFLRALTTVLSTVRGPLFTTDATGLYDTFLEGMPLASRQTYNCRTCRHFVDRFGSLVTLGAQGEAEPIMWPLCGYPGIFSPGGLEARRLVLRARVTGVFLTSEPFWGVRENVSSRTGILWKHMSGQPLIVFQNSPLVSAEQEMALKREEFNMLQRSLADFPHDIAVQAMKHLQSGNLYRSEKAEGIATWFVDLHESLRDVRGPRRDNIIWRAVALAPRGFAHMRGGMLGTLLEDLLAGLPFSAISQKWAQKMNPLQYMRPQAAPTAGNIVQAEKAIEVLRASGALDRRFARLDEVQTIWLPRPVVEEQKCSGVFSHLKPKGSKDMTKDLDSPAVRMTFEKFRREVMPGAIQMEAFVKSVDFFVAMLTAADPLAPPIIQWDSLDRRNPLNWYVYPMATPACQWGLEAGWSLVTGVSLLPPMYDEARDHGNQGKGVFFLLPGCVDTKESGIALFPEVLKSEYRPYRATIEAYSRSAKLSGREQASACGLDLRAGRGDTWDRAIRVTDSRGIRSLYKLDRWD